MSLSLTFKPRCLTSQLRQTKTRHMLSYCRKSVVLSVNYTSLRVSCHREATLLPWPQPPSIQPFPVLIWMHRESLQSSKTRLFTRMFSVLLLSTKPGKGSRGWARTHFRDKEARKAGAAQLPLAASHKLSWAVPSSCTLTHLMNPT